MPNYPNVDELIVVDRAFSLFNNNSYELNYFKYPSISFYYGKLSLYIFNLFGTDINTYNAAALIRHGFSFIFSLSLFFLFYSARLILNTYIAYIAIFLQFTSLFFPSTLFYSSPDFILYFFSTLIFYIFTVIYKSENDKIIIHVLFPFLYLSIGMAIAIKYNAIVFVLFVLYLIYYKKYYTSLTNMSIIFYSSVLIIIIFCILNPYAMMDTKRFITDFMWNINHYKMPNTGLHSNNGLVVYLNSFTFSHNGFPGVILYIVGSFGLIYNKKFNILLILTIIPVTLIYKMTSYHIFLSRNMAIAIPYYFIVSAYGLYFIKKLSIILFILIILFYSSTTSYNIYTIYLNSIKPDGRELAEEWIIRNIPIKSTLYVKKTALKFNYLPKLDSNKYKIILTPPPPILNSNEYYIQSSYWYFRYMKPKDILFGNSNEMLNPDQKKLYLDKIKNYKLLKVFICGKKATIVVHTDVKNNLACTGPTIKIFQKII